MTIALSFEKYPFNYFPVRNNISKTKNGFFDKNSTKVSPLKKWKEYQEKKYDKKITGKNRAIITGTVDVNLNPIVVIDLDNVLEDFSVEEFLTKFGLPTTRIVKTGSGGYHLHYALPKKESFADILRNSQNHKQKVEYKNIKIDFRAQGGLVFAPPTKFTNKDPYVWYNDEDIAIVTEELVLQFFKDTNIKDPVSKKSEKETSSDDNKKLAGVLVSKLTNLKILKGERSVFALGLSSFCKRQGYSYTECRKIANYCQSILDVENEKQYDLIKYSYDNKLSFKYVDLFNKYLPGVREDTKRTNKNSEKALSVDKIKNQTGQMLEDLREEHHQLIVRELEEIVFFDNSKGLFEIDKKDLFLRSRVNTYIKSINEFNTVDTKHINEAINKHKNSLTTGPIKDLDFFYKRSKFVDTDTIIYCTGNCLIQQNFKTGEIIQKKHDYKEYFISKLNFTFKVEPDPSYWLDRLGEAIPVKEDLELLLLFFAYTLIPDFVWKVSLFVQGPTNTGKSTIIDNFVRVFDNIERTKLSDLKKDLFAIQGLLHADIWFINEIARKYFENDTWKNIVEGGVVAIRQMYSGIKIKKKVDLKIIQIANELQKINDEATLARLLVIKFAQRFDRDNTTDINRLLRENLDDFISWLIIEKVPEYFRRIPELTELQKTRTYEYYEMNEDPWQRVCDTIISPHLPKDENDEVFEYASKQITELVNEYFKNHGFSIMSNRQTGGKIGYMVKEGIVPFQHAKRTRVYYEGNQERGWKNIIIDLTKTKSKNH